MRLVLGVVTGLLATAISVFSSSAHADETKRTRPSRKWSIEGPTRLMWIGGATFALGYLLYALPATTCEVGCREMGKLYVPFVGYGRYAGDAGYRFVSTYDVVGWVPTFAQGAGALLVAGGALVQRPLGRQQPLAQWTFNLRPGPGGALLGVMGAF
jgi:hypothetical protein